MIVIIIPCTLASEVVTKINSIKYNLQQRCQPQECDGIINTLSSSKLFVITDTNRETNDVMMSFCGLAAFNYFIKIIRYGYMHCASLYIEILYCTTNHILTLWWNMWLDVSIGVLNLHQHTLPPVSGYTLCA